MFGWCRLRGLCGLLWYSESKVAQAQPLGVYFCKFIDTKRVAQSLIYCKQETNLKIGAEERTRTSTP